MEVSSSFLVSHGHSFSVKTVHTIRFDIVKKTCFRRYVDFICNSLDTWFQVSEVSISISYRSDPTDWSVWITRSQILKYCVIFVVQCIYSLQRMTFVFLDSTIIILLILRHCDFHCFLFFLTIDTQVYSTSLFILKLRTTTIVVTMYLR